MKYNAVVVYGLDYTFYGYGIHEAGTTMVKPNLYASSEADEFKKTLADLNERDILRQYWPDPHEPEVQEMVENLPEQTQQAEVVDEDASVLYYRHDPVLDMEVIDEEYSELVYKTMEVPVPGSSISQIEEACEIIARRRAGLDA